MTKLISKKPQIVVSLVTKLLLRLLFLLFVFGRCEAQQTIVYSQSGPSVSSYALTVFTPIGTSWSVGWSVTQQMPYGTTGNWMFTLAPTNKLNPGDTYYLQSVNANGGASDKSNTLIFSAPVTPSPVPTLPRPTPPVLIQITGNASIVVNGTPIP